MWITHSITHSGVLLDPCGGGGVALARVRCLPFKGGYTKMLRLGGFSVIKKKNDSWLSSDFLVFLSKILQLNVVVSFRKASSVIEYVVCGLPVICHLFNTVLLDSHSDKTFSILCMCFSCDWDCAFLVFYFFYF